MTVPYEASEDHRPDNPDGPVAPDDGPLRPGNPPSSYARVTAEDAMAAEFTVTRWGAHGYHETEVDTFLDRIWATLRRYEDNNYLLLGLIGRLHGVQDKREVAEIAAKMTEVIEAWPTK